MTRLVRSLAAAALATATFAATPALADHGHRRPPPPPVYVPAPAPPPPARLEHRAHRRELLREYRKLERARERFYARWHGHPAERRRFERWYDARRAELDRAWYRHSALARVEIELR